ncbi:10070_t:CDS:2 [Diversispora eburnea]|uniref:10070_t:CDS:1 n=1 Tax=Diversispora eburnea TaxID=1213867 RepID=A0A9N8WB21_9GLOM|nr:10070_t:CDS:2 [Diversispora eburnea]
MLSKPQTDINDLLLVKATPEQSKITKQISYIEGDPSELTLEQYLELEKILTNLEFTRDNFQVWILISKKDQHQEAPTILSTCGTIKRKALVKDTTTDKSDKLRGVGEGGRGNVREIICHSIASVFTPLNFRNNGYASSMLKLLSDILVKELKAEFSFLFSDIGPHFYQRLGWNVDDHKEIRFNVDNNTHISDSANNLDNNIIVEDTKKIISQDDLERIIQQDCQLIYQEFSQLDFSAFLVLPTKPNFEWHFERSKIYAKIKNVEITTLGVELIGRSINNNKNNHSLGFILWFHDFRDQKLTILRFRSNNQKVTKLLIEHAKREAQRSNLTQVVVWNPDMKLFPNVKEGNNKNDDNGELVERKDSLPFLACHYKEPSHFSHFKWLLLEKYTIFCRP